MQFTEAERAIFLYIHLIAMMVDGRDIGIGLKIEQKLRHTETQNLNIYVRVACSYLAFFSWAPAYTK